jgi:hypothetical protein
MEIGVIRFDTSFYTCTLVYRCMFNFSGCSILLENDFIRYDKQKLQLKEI